MPYFGHNKISRECDGETIEGITLRAFIHNGETYHLTEISIYRDGMIDCWELVDFDGFKKKVSDGWVVTTIPEGAEVSIYGLSLFQAARVNSFMREGEFIKEVADEIARMNNQPTTIAKCLAAYKQFRRKGTEETKANLKQAYEDIPEHKRRHRDILGFDPRRILNIIYG